MAHRGQPHGDIGLGPADGQIQALRIGNGAARRRGETQHDLAETHDMTLHRTHSTLP
jgi:hypothetical protein